MSVSSPSRDPLARRADVPRRGILAGGNFITDYVKILDGWPEQDSLADIRRESMHNGGGPYNLLKDLSALGADFPLEAVGRVGNDANGRWILEDCRDAGIDVEQLRITDEAPTSYTDAMTDEATGRRTFFHQQGANATLQPVDFDFSASGSKLFMLGFLMLLRSLDELDGDGRTGASRVLEAATNAGFTTAADCVSASGAAFRRVVLASLPHLDLLFLNEVEAGRVLQDEVPAHRGAMEQAGAALLKLGVRSAVVLHCAQGAVVVQSDGRHGAQGKVALPPEKIVGSTGAGDAFAAGFLHGWHEQQSAATCLEQGVCVAAASLSDASASGGVKPLGECLHLGVQHGFADF